MDYLGEVLKNKEDSRITFKILDGNLTSWWKETKNTPLTSIGLLQLPKFENF
jgi:hypothetical protein